MIILIIALLLMVSIKKLISAGLFTETYKKLVKCRDDILAGDQINIEVLEFRNIFIVIFMLAFLKTYAFYVGMTIPQLIIPTAIMIAFTIYIAMKKPDIKNIGKYTIGSVAKDTLEVVYYAYFLYVLI